MKLITTTLTIEDAPENIARALIVNLCREDATDAEKWQVIRDVRNTLIGRTDWTQLPDAVLAETQKEMWRNRRQSLRNFTESSATPEEVIFEEWMSEI
jgi:hypothetical protein